MKIHFQDDVKALEPEASVELQKFLSGVFEDFKTDADEVTFRLANDAEVSRLNETYRGISGTTDVLSFPDGEKNPDGSCSLGDIVISWDKIQSQASEFNNTPLEELYKMALHGMLHLLGYDHPEGDTAMEELEKKYLKGRKT